MTDSARLTDDRPLLPFLVLLFVGSGCAALIYEVVWMQLLSLIVGSNAISMGVILGTFMGGMCLGSLLLSKYVTRSEHPLRVYALLELGIGVFGILIPLILPHVGGLYTAIGGQIKLFKPNILVLATATTGAPGGSYILTRFGLADLEAGYAVSRLTGHVGDEIRVTYTVRNVGWLPKLWLEVHNPTDLPNGLPGRAIGLGGRTERSWLIRLPLARRGTFRVEALRIRAADPFGLFEAAASVEWIVPVM